LARTVFIGPVWFMKAHPEAERLILRPLLQELAKVAHVIAPRDARRRHVLRQLVESRSGRIAGPPTRPEIARPPTLARQANKVARLLQKIRIRLEAGRKNAVVADRLLKLPRIATGENACPAGTAFGIRREGILE